MKALLHALAPLSGFCAGSALGVLTSDGPAAFPFLIGMIVLGSTLQILSNRLRAQPAGIAPTTWAGGAVAGSLATGFLLLPAFGETPTILSTALVAIVLRLFDRAPAADRPPGRAWAASPPLVACAATGASLGLYGAAWERAFAFSIGPTVYPAVLVLGALFLGLSAGLLIAGPKAAKPKDPLSVLAILLASGGAATALFGHFIGELPVQMAEIVSDLAARPGPLLAVQVLIVAALVSIPTAALGAAFPFALRLSSAAPVVGWTAGGALAGALSTGFLPLPGPADSIAAGAAVNLVTAAVLFGLPGVEGVPKKRWIAAIPAGLVLVAWRLADTWETSLLASGPYEKGPVYLRAAAGRGADLRRLMRESSLLTASLYDPFGLVTLHRHDRLLEMRVDGRAAGSNSLRDAAPDRLLGHLPLLHAENARRACVIGLGPGFSLAAALAHPVERVDLLEPSRGLIEAAGQFAEVNRKALLDSRVTFLREMPREAFASTSPYDAILCRPPPPWVRGASELYTRDFFQQAKSRLTPGGFLAQAVGAHHLPAGDFQSIAATFRSVFPGASIWELFPGEEYVLLGAASDAPIPFSRIAARLEPKEVKADLASIGVTSASALLRNLALAGESMARFAASPVTLRDGHNPIAWSSARAILRDARPELLSTLAPLREKTTESSLFVAAPDSTSKLRATRARVAEAVRLGAEGRATEALRLFDGIRRAGDFELLAEGRHNTLLTEIKQRAGFLERAGRLDEALQAYLEVPESSIRHPEALVSIARLHRRMRKNDEAKRTYERIPKEAREHHVALADLAEMAEDDEDWAAAAAGWSRLLAAAPAETGAYVRLAKAYDKLGLRVEARETARHAVALDPELSKSLQELLERIDP